MSKATLGERLAVYRANRRRRMVLPVGREMLAGFFNGNLRVEPRLPDDVSLIQIGEHGTFMENKALFMLQSAEFPETPEGQEYPEYPCVIVAAEGSNDD